MVKAVATLLYLLCGLVSTINTSGINVEHQHLQMEPMDYQQIRKLQSLNLKFTEYFQNGTVKDMDMFSPRLLNK
ncbi:hypothetical protein AWZ03_015474, partial [Drosophila navojoa]